MIFKIKESVDFIKTQINEIPEIALVLGSGLGVLADDIENPIEIEYKDIPGFLISTIEGHEGKLISGKLNGKNVIVMKGRFHFYEGYSMTDIVYPIRVFISLGIKTLVVTNAAGGINTSFNLGDIMLINDHIKFFDDSPLRGKNIDEFGPRFNDMSDAYNKKIRELAKETAYELGIEIHEGVYGFMPGPSYETPAEIKMLKIVGADAVGMSTVPEVITAAHGGMNVLAISCISNMAAGISDERLSHQEVIENTEIAKDNLLKLIRLVVNKL
jgi:purine-nucleoside phosphorylase